MTNSIRRHIQAIAARSRPDALRLTHQLHRGCWPGGGGDRPAALVSAHRWAPMTDGNTGLICMCPSGRCPICN